MLYGVKQILAGRAWKIGDVGSKEFKPREKRIPSFLANKAQVKNYENRDIYRIEKDFLEWFDYKMQDENWCKNRFARIYMCSMIVEEMYGRPYGKKDYKYGQIYSKIFRHYSSVVKTSYWDKERQKSRSKRAYHLSIYRRRTVMPYSLRLRAEKICSEDRDIDVSDMHIEKQWPDDKYRDWSVENRKKKRKERIEENRRLGIKNQYWVERRKQLDEQRKAKEKAQQNN